MSLILWVLYTLLGLLLATVGWGLWRVYSHPVENGLVAWHDRLLVWLSLLGTIALAAFLIYLLAGLGP
jgi:sulfite exporter TauE/SafE